MINTNKIKPHAHNYLNTLNPKSRTRTLYGFVLTNFFKFINKKHINLLRIEQFLQSPALTHHKTISPAYFNMRLHALRGFFNYLEQHNIIKKNPTRYIKSKKTTHNESQRTLSLDELNFILRRTHGDAQHALFILANTGLRISELVNIRRNNIKLEHLHDRTAWVLTIKTKGNKTRRLELNAETHRIIKKRFAQYNYLANTPLFPSITRHGQCASSMTIYNKIKKQLKKIGFSQVSPHWFRHSFAQQLHQQNINTQTIQGALGHTNLNTTQQYLQRMQIVPTQIKLNLKLKLSETADHAPQLPHSNRHDYKP